MSQPSFAASLDGHLASLSASDRSPFAIGGRLLEFIGPILDQSVHALGGIDAVISHAHAAYDKFCVPLDIPGIPDIAEPAVDAAAKALIAKALRAAHDRLHKE